MAFHGYASFKGTKQGAFKGKPTANSVPTKAKIQLPGWRYRIDAQVDLRDGLSTGKQTDGSFKSSKNVDSASPHLFSYAVPAPRDLGNISSTGKRQHQPFVIMRETDSATPLLLQAFHANTVFREIVVQIISDGSGGRETVVETITLINSTISDVKHYMPSASRNSEKTSTGGTTLAVYSFEYSSIVIPGGRNR